MQLCSLRYNKVVFLGVQDECGAMDVFRVWHDHVNEKRATLTVEKLMENYELPIFVNVGRSRESINAFFQAKYGLFTCFDSIYHFGAIDFDPELIAYWER